MLLNAIYFFCCLYFLEYGSGTSYCFSYLQCCDYRLPAHIETFVSKHRAFTFRANKEDSEGKEREPERRAEGGRRSPLSLFSLSPRPSLPIQTPVLYCFRQVFRLDIITG